MNRQEVLDLMYSSVVDDMTFMYSNAGLDQDTINGHIEQNAMAFQLICSNMYEKLTESGVINA